MNTHTLQLRAIRGAWACARAAGMEPAAAFYPQVGVMSRDERVRRGMVAAWLAGYRHGRASGSAERAAGHPGKASR
ncbi:MAG: hypothetical protein K2Q20_10305 [Phycisphaerales bacterium]|nr:hypothetical protein [Phycisphaerales bacterium]